LGGSYIKKSNDFDENDLGWKRKTDSYMIEIARIPLSLPDENENIMLPVT
jgi:hypothetical protein